MYNFVVCYRGLMWSDIHDLIDREIGLDGGNAEQLQCLRALASDLTGKRT
jgi:hypothetical protein